MDARVTIETEGQEVVASEIRKKIIRYNAERAGEPNDVRLVLSSRDPEGNLIGGLVALGFWNGLFVDLLWVSETHRGRGIGKALLSAAEVKARENGWQVCFLSTFDFQAPGFYLKLGYKQFGELKGSPPGHSRKWFAKWL
jgi:GNAT superfamily N-acetyltransferase